VNELIPPYESEPKEEITGTTPALSFQPRLGTYILLFFLLVVWPGASLSFMMLDTAQVNWELYDPVYFIYLPTIIIQWLIFIAVALGIYREKSTFRSIGFVRLRWKDLFLAVGFLLVSNLILAILQQLLSLFGMAISQDVDVLVNKARETIWWWLAVSVTAAICEETAFRGYIMTRVKGLYRKGGWLLPVVLSSLSFASGHSYQGAAGLILLFIYGLLFCGLYIYSKSLWPCILAHFIQDFSAIFLYNFMHS
jgi:membrane protease YdiL (CAAX protease family)